MMTRACSLRVASAKQRFDGTTASRAIAMRLRRFQAREAAEACVLQTFLFMASMTGSGTLWAADAALAIVIHGCQTGILFTFAFQPQAGFAKGPPCASPSLWYRADLVRLRPHEHQRWLGDRKPYRAVGADGDVPIPDRAYRDRGFFGTKEIGGRSRQPDAVTWPKSKFPDDVAGNPQCADHGAQRLLTVGVAFAVYFASSGIESLRIGLNRAYGVIEMRNWMVLRLESIAYVLVGAISMLALGFLIVLGPLIFRHRD